MGMAFLGKNMHQINVIIFFATIYRAVYVTAETHYGGIFVLSKSFSFCRKSLVRFVLLFILNVKKFFFFACVGAKQSITFIYEVLKLIFFLYKQVLVLLYNESVIKLSFNRRLNI